MLFRTLRFRLAFWFTISLGLIVLLLAAYLYLQLRRSLLDQVDTSLQLVALQAQNNLLDSSGRLAFQSITSDSSESRPLLDDSVIRLVAPDGIIWESLGAEDEAPKDITPGEGFTTVADSSDRWRLYSQAIQVGQTAGWLQVFQELEPVQMTLQSLLTQMFWGVPLAILLAGLGGYLLASRALRPVDRITQTAQSITSTDLKKRIDHTGPADEIGRLAQTIDDMLDRLQSAFEREKRFTGDAAHELRTPLTALKGRIGVTLGRPRPVSEYTKTLEEMEQQVDRLIRLSSDLLYMARLDRSQLEQDMEPIDLNELLGSVVDQIRPLAEVKFIALVENIPGGLRLKANLDLLIRLFLNLLDNAVKFTPPGGTVTVWAEAENPELQIGISDTGPGIPAEHLPHLFERFYRVEEDRARPISGGGAGGSGLGLAIAYEIARLHGGRLTVQSEPGQGTTFTLHLPQNGDKTRSSGKVLTYSGV